MTNSQKEALRQSKVMLDYSNGGEIEFNNHIDGWHRAEYPDWDWSISSYRVKPKNSCHNCKYYDAPEWCNLTKHSMSQCDNESEWIEAKFDD